MQRIIYACDIGSTIPASTTKTPQFAWVRFDTAQSLPITGSSDIVRLVESLHADVNQRSSIALGIEAPLFIPIPRHATSLSRGRIGEGNRSFAAPPGLAVTTLALHQITWLLQQLQPIAAATHTFTLDINRWLHTTTTPLLFVWEAFVSGSAHSHSHLRDAATAAVAFWHATQTSPVISHVTVPDDEPPLSLIGTAALWSGWTTEISILRQATLVIKPTTASQEPIIPI